MQPHSGAFGYLAIEHTAWLGESSSGSKKKKNELWPNIRTTSLNYYMCAVNVSSILRLSKVQACMNMQPRSNIPEKSSVSSQTYRCCCCMQMCKHWSNLRKLKWPQIKVLCHLNQDKSGESCIFLENWIMSFLRKHFFEMYKPEWSNIGWASTPQFWKMADVFPLLFYSTREFTNVYCFISCVVFNPWMAHRV